MKDYANYVYDASNRLTAIQNAGGSTLHTLSYDVQGNVTAKDTASYTFDYGNRLRLGTGPGGSEGYRYDGHGRRALAWVPAGATLSFYAFNGQLLYQHSTPKARALDHIYLAGSLVAIRETPFAGGSEVKYQHTDALGSPVAISNAAGTVTERTNYDPYGGAINKTVDGVGYTGHVMDPVTGLTYMQQRYYYSEIGMFLSVDPVPALSDPFGQFNRYRYGNSNAYRFSDPDGRLACDCQQFGAGETQYFDGGHVPVSSLPEIDPIDARLVSRVQEASAEMLLTITPYVGVAYGLSKGDDVAALEAAQITAGHAIEESARNANQAETSKAEARQQRGLLGKSGKRELRIARLDRRTKIDGARLGRSVTGIGLKGVGFISAFKTWRKKLDEAAREHREAKKAQQRERR